jgi:TRAP-type C4-dicarboxylate transport system substrate-binding protein
MTDRPSAYGIGAMVLRKEAWEALSPEDRKLLLGGTEQMNRELTANVRRDNERAKKAMTKAGIEMVHVDDPTQAKLEEAGKQVWTRLAGKVYSQEILDRVVATVAEAR